VSGLFTGPRIEGSADSTGGRRLDGDIIEVTEVKVRRVVEERKPFDMQPTVLGNEENGAQPIAKRVGELAGQAGDVAVLQAGKLAPQDLLYLGNGVAVDGQRVIIDPPDAKHLTKPFGR
jgi:hypothetical protein